MGSNGFSPSGGQSMEPIPFDFEVFYAKGTNLHMVYTRIGDGFDLWYKLRSQVYDFELRMLLK